MSTLSVYLGWYAIVTPSQDSKIFGMKNVRVCSGTEKHKHGGGNFCSVCGLSVIHKDIPTSKKISLATHFFEETDPEELEYQSNGHATIEDMEKLKGSYAVFPEYLPQKFKNPIRKEIIMAPCYQEFLDIRHMDSDVSKISDKEAPSHEWVELIRKVLGATEVELEYGIVFEVW